MRRLTIIIAACVISGGGAAAAQSESQFRIGPPPIGPQCITLSQAAADGGGQVSVCTDGTVRHEGIEPNEAAKIFWDGVRRYIMQDVALQCEQERGR